MKTSPRSVMLASIMRHQIGRELAEMIADGILLAFAENGWAVKGRGQPTTEFLAEGLQATAGTCTEEMDHAD